MSEPMLGQLLLFGGNYAPRGWEFCQGQLLSLMDYQALYSLLGANFGGDGRSTFGVPDLRGRVVLGCGAAPGRTSRVIGQAGGYERVTLSIPSLPTHTHLINTEITGEIQCSLKCNNTDQANQNEPSGNFPGKSRSSTDIYASTTDTNFMAPEAIETINNLEVNSSNEETGGSQPHENMPPWLCLNYIIAKDGYYPPRT